MDRDRSLLISFSWCRGRKRWLRRLGRARVSSPSWAGGLLRPKALVPTLAVQVVLFKSCFKTAVTMRSPFVFWSWGGAVCGGHWGHPITCCAGMPLRGLSPWILSERQNCSRMSVPGPGSRGVQHPGCLLGTIPCGGTSVFQPYWGSAAAVGSGIQPHNPCSSLRAWQSPGHCKLLNLRKSLLMQRGGFP